MKVLYDIKYSDNEGYGGFILVSDGKTATADDAAEAIKERTGLEPMIDEFKPLGVIDKILDRFPQLL